MAIPGSHTTAALLLRIFVGDPPIIEVAFDKIPTVVAEGQADLGLLIHEGQITHRQMGLHKVMDLGEEWQKDSGLPLPLGINVMRRDLGEEVHLRLSQALRDSIDYAYAHVGDHVGVEDLPFGGVGEARIAEIRRPGQRLGKK